MTAGRSWLIAAPTIVGAALGVVWWLLAPAGSFQISLAPIALTMSFGGLSSVLLGSSLIRRGRDRQRVEAAAEVGRLEGEQSAHEAHRRLLARLDHELKNPITAIRTALAAEPESETSPNLRIAAAQADRLAALLGGLRSLAALETQSIEIERVDLADIASEEVATLNQELAAHGATRHISLHLPTVPWPLPAVAGDPDLLAMAVRNLLVNAAKYSGEGAQIELRGSEDDEAVVLEVADTGRGIPAADLEHVWDELWRGDEVRRIEGSGLGLSLVRVVVERHGGQVSLQSQPGLGTSVRIRLPVAKS